MLRASLRALENRTMKAIRDPRASQIADREPVAFSQSALTGHRYLLLITSRRDGRQIATPMWFAADGEDRLVMRSGAADPKLARIRRNPDVKVAACDLRGRPLGPPMCARARILRPDEERRAELALRRALGWPRALYDVFRAPLLPMAYIEVTPSDASKR